MAPVGPPGYDLAKSIRYMSQVPIFDDLKDIFSSRMKINEIFYVLVGMNHTGELIILQHL